ncbi:hypothetical protein MKZ01_14030 [Lysinibacillus endophyticus]
MIGAAESNEKYSFLFKKSIVVDTQDVTNKSSNKIHNEAVSYIKRIKSLK